MKGIKWKKIRGKRKDDVAFIKGKEKSRWSEDWFRTESAKK